MTRLPDRQHAVSLIQEAQPNGASLVKACALISLSVRTYQRWTAHQAVSADQRPVVPRPIPHNKLPGPARGTWFYLYLMMDVYSRKIVGHEVYARETGELACEIVEKAYWREHLAARSKPLVLHSDNGSPMKAATFLEKLYDLGITPSNSRPRVSNDNAYSESLFKTLKFRPGFPVSGFKTIDEARSWGLMFVRWYNTEHRHSALKYVTPEQRHNGEAKKVLDQRRQVLEEERAKNPQRWSGDIRNLSLPETVTLNPEKAANF